jgi:hypothetical protein
VSSHKYKTGQLKRRRLRLSSARRERCEQVDAWGRPITYTTDENGKLREVRR